MRQEAAPIVKKIKVVEVGPFCMDNLYKTALISRNIQNLLLQLPILPCYVSVPSKKLQYEELGIVNDGQVLVKLPQNNTERELMAKQKTWNILEVKEEDITAVIKEENGKLKVKGFSEHELQQLKIYWEKAKLRPNKFSRALYVLRSFLRGFLGIKSTDTLQIPFPLFRDVSFAVFPGTKKECRLILLEELRQRYEKKRDITKVQSKMILTANLDHMLWLFQKKNEVYREAYDKTWFITADGYPPLITFARESLGYSVKEQVTGVSLFMELINIIGAEALPYTIYLIGGFGNIPYQTRDYFINVYPSMKDNFVGISTPPLGFLDKPEVFDAICEDINKKKPDIIFAGMTAVTQERIFLELQKRNINFGFGVGVGRAVELVVGYQKAPPKIFTKLHLDWLHRAFTLNKDKGKGLGKMRYFGRVVEDLKFAIKTTMKD